MWEGSTKWPLPTQEREPSPGTHGLPTRFREGDRRTRTPCFPLSNAGRRLETPSWPLPPAACPDPRRSGGQDFRAPGPQGPSAPAVPVAPVSPVSSLFGPSSLSRPPSFHSAGALSPSDYLGSPPPKPEEAVERSVRAFPRGSGERVPLAAPTRAPTSRLRSGSGHCWLARYRRALLSPKRRRALQRRGAGAEGKRGTRSHPAAGGGGGAEGWQEPASERTSEASSARDSPARSAFIPGPALLFPRNRSPAHLTCGRL